MRNLKVVSVCVVLACSPLLGACGSSSSSSSDTVGDATDAPIALSGAVHDHGTKDLSGEGATAKIEMEADDVYFGPTYVKVAPGATLTIELENEGKMEHTLTIDGTDVDEEVAPGKSAEVEVTVPADGALEFHCRYHGGQGMRGAVYSADGQVVTNAGETSDPTVGAGGYGY